MPRCAADAELGGAATDAPVQDGKTRGNPHPVGIAVGILMLTTAIGSDWVVSLGQATELRGSGRIGTVQVGSGRKIAQFCGSCHL